MIAFTNSMFDFFNNLQSLLGSLGEILLAPIKALAYLIKWVIAVFQFLPKFFEYAFWAIDVLPSPLDDIAFFLLTFISCTLFIGVIKLIVR